MLNNAQKVCKITTYVTFKSLDKPGKKNHFCKLMKKN